MTTDQPSPPGTGFVPTGALQVHRCGNCEAILTGPFCAQCGQHAHASARDLQAVIHDAWHDITHVDGRLWHTLWLLLSRPGRLTVDYFAERRARYLPPVRLYLVLSVVFFSLSVGGESGKHAKAGHRAPAAKTTQAPAPATPAPAPAPDANTRAAQADAARSATPPAAVKDHAAPAKPAAADQEDADDDDKDPDVTTFPATMGYVSGSGPGCDQIRVAGIAMLERAVRESCWRNSADNGAAFVRALVHNAPKMMFAFLPLMAAVMTLMYWRPRRYYVEHLVFLLHNHSALYLWFVLLNLTGRLVDLWHPLSALFVGLGFVTLFYVVWYPYAAMRRYYGQSRTLTATKFTVIGLAYFVCLLLTLIAGAIVTALEN